MNEAGGADRRRRNEIRNISLNSKGKSNENIDILSFSFGHKFTVMGWN
jgi:hypothetical protein